MAESTDILTPILGFAGVVITSLGTLVVKKWIDKKDADSVVTDGELQFTLVEYNELHQRMLELQSDTPADRFLIMKAENGVTQPRFATVIYEQFKTRQMFIAFLVYTRILIDDSYREMLKGAELKGVCEMETATMPDCKLRGFYEQEKVTFSNCYFLTRYERGGGATIIYATIATHSPEGFTKAEKFKMAVFADYLRETFQRKTDKNSEDTKQ